jgi:FAD/FMN-containing dehydrogenase
MKIISGLKSSFAVRSGGHSPNPGASSIDKTGVLIDMKRLSDVSVSSDKKSATVGAGARWGHVYSVLDEAKTIVIGARLPQVGVGGSIIGGKKQLIKVRTALLTLS